MALTLTLFFILLSGGSAIGATFGKRYEESLPLVTMGSILLLFLFGIAGALKAGVYALICILGAGWFLAAVLVLKRKAFRDFCQRFFSPGFWIFLILYLAMAYLHRGRMAWEWDEFSHWMDSVKAMVSVDDFNTSPLLPDQLFPSYVPGMGLFQYFFQKVMMLVKPEAAFCEWGAYFAYHLLAVSLLLPFLRHTSFRRMISTGLLFTLVCLAPTILYGQELMKHYLTTVYIDPFLGVACGAGLAWVYVNGCKDWLSVLYLALLACTLTLSKDIGLFFSLVLAGAASIACLTEGEWRKKAAWGKTAGVICGALGPKLLWNLHLSMRNVRKSFSSPIDLEALWQIMRGQNETWRQGTYYGYFQKLLTEPTEMTLGAPTYPVVILVLALLLGVLYHLGRKAQRSETNRLRRKILCLAVVQVVIYAVGMVGLYLFKFGEYEGTRYASYDRYLRVPFLAVLMMALLIALHQASRLNDRRYLATLSMGTLLCCTIPSGDIWEYMSRSSVIHSMEVRNVYEGEAQLMDEVSNQGAKVYWISQRSDGYDYYLMRFRMKPYQINRGGWSISSTGPLYENDVWTRTVSPESWAETLKESYGYVYLHSIEESFVQNYGELFQESPVSEKLYKVVISGDEVTLVPAEEVY